MGLQPIPFDRSGTPPGTAAVYRADRPIRGVEVPLLRLEVGNPGKHGTIEHREPSPHADDGGYGLELVALLSSRWGVRRAADTHVWFELGTA